MRKDLFTLVDQLVASACGCDRLIEEIRTLAEYGITSDIKGFTKVIEIWATHKSV